MALSTTEKTCTRCHEDWPADAEFFRPQPRRGDYHRLAPWCRACEADYQTVKRAAPATTEPAFVNSVWSLAC